MPKSEIYQGLARGAATTKIVLPPRAESQAKKYFALREPFRRVFSLSGTNK